MQTFFEEELAKLRKRINKMFQIAGSQLEKSYQSVFSGDFETADTALQNENRLDKLDTKIDKLCQRIFALAQPVATDLRFIMSSLRIGNEIERIGDIAFDIINRSESVRAYQQTLQPYGTDVMFKEVIKTFGQVAESYTNNNNELAREITDKCIAAEEQCKQAFQDVISQMAVKADVITIATDLILIIRDIERISNHLKNIAESIIFIVEGRRLKGT